MVHLPASFRHRSARLFAIIVINLRERKTESEKERQRERELRKYLAQNSCMEQVKPLTRLRFTRYPVYPLPYQLIAQCGQSVLEREGAERESERAAKRLSVYLITCSSCWRPNWSAGRTRLKLTSGR